MRLISLVGVMLACLASAGAHLGCGEFACDACTALLQRQDSCAAQCAAAKLLETVRHSSPHSLDSDIEQKCITLTGQLAVDCGCKGDDAVNAFNECKFCNLAAGSRDQLA